MELDHLFSHVQEKPAGKNILLTLIFPITFPSYYFQSVMSTEILKRWYFVVHDTFAMPSNK